VGWVPDEETKSELGPRQYPLGCVLGKAHLTLSAKCFK